MSNNNSSKGVMSLTEIWNSHLDEVEPTFKGDILKAGFVLVVSLSSAEKKGSSKGADTIRVNNGYITKAKNTDSKIYSPFLTSWNGFALQPGEGDKIQLLQLDNAGRMNPELEGVKINWKINLDSHFISSLLQKELMRDGEAWREFQNSILTQQRCQLQMMVMPSVDPVKGKGKLQQYTNDTGTETVYNIQLSKADVYTCRLVVPGPSFLGKIDKPGAVMGRLEGRLVADGTEKEEEIKVVSIFDSVKPIKSEATPTPVLTPVSKSEGVVPTEETPGSEETAEDEDSDYSVM